jgi:hypothetical protein
VYDYVAGKSDWLAADVPFEGTAQLAGLLIRREVATVSGAPRRRVTTAIRLGSDQVRQADVPGLGEPPG